MKNTKKKLAAKVAGRLMKVTSGAVNSACQLLMHQLELPKGNIENWPLACMGQRRSFL